MTSQVEQLKPPKTLGDSSLTLVCLYSRPTSDTVYLLFNYLGIYCVIMIINANLNTQLHTDSELFATIVYLLKMPNNNNYLC